MQFGEFGVGESGPACVGFVCRPLEAAFRRGPGIQPSAKALRAATSVRGSRLPPEWALVPAGRLGRTEDLIGPLLFLASAESRFVTGQVLYVDGGRTLV